MLLLLKGIVVDDPMAFHVLIIMFSSPCSHLYALTSILLSPCTHHHHAFVLTGITYTVFADQAVMTDTFSGTMKKKDRKSINRPVSSPDKEDRVSRGNYYGILSLDEATDPEIAEDVTGGGEDKKRQLQDIDAANAVSYSEMRSTYMMRPSSAYRSQIEEDEDVEKYWYSLLRNLPRD